MNIRPYRIPSDYLGNNRAVINGSTGAIEQTVAYYLYGGVIADHGTNKISGQPYKFGGKELITANGLNEYDFGTRQCYQAVPHFTKPDPLYEKYYWLSPYLYCANNPVNAIDPDGCDIGSFDENGYVIDSQSFGYFDMLLFYGSNMNIKNNWIGDNGSIIDHYASLDKMSRKYAVFKAKDDKAGTSVFEALADNTSVEWSVLQLGLEKNDIENVITTSHEPKSEAGATAFIVENIFEIDIRNAFHSHPSGIEYPSGLDWNPKKPGDVQFAGWVDRINRNTQAIYKIYNPRDKTYIEYNSESTYFDFPRK